MGLFNMLNLKTRTARIRTSSDAQMAALDQLHSSETRTSGGEKQPTSIV